MTNRNVVCATLLLAGLLHGCALRGQRYSDFITPTPLPTTPQPTIVLGFLGGREPWDNPRRNVRQFALGLRARQLPGLHVETVENARRALAVRLLKEALDRNRDGQLDPAERESARIILYGQSFGGAAVVKLAHELDALGVPVLLTVQIDSVGRNDALVPANVSCALNLYQRNGMFVRGEPRIRASDPARTRILGNFRYDYRKRKIDLSRAVWWKRWMATAHTKMDYDLEVWQRVEEVVLGAVRTGGCGEAAQPAGDFQ